MTSHVPNFIGYGKKMAENLFGKRNCKLERKRTSRTRGFRSYEPVEPFVALLLLPFQILLLLFGQNFTEYDVLSSLLTLCILHL